MELQNTYLTDLQLANIYSVTRQTIWRWVKDDANFPKPIKLSGGATRWKSQEIKNWEENKATNISENRKINQKKHNKEKIELIDYFAAKAMQSYILHPDYKNVSAADICEYSYLLAENMLKARIY